MAWQVTAYDSSGNTVDFDESKMKPKSAWKKSLIMDQLLTLGLDASIVKRCTADVLKKTTLIFVCTRPAGRYSAQTNYYSVDPNLTNEDLMHISTIVPEKKEPESQLEIVKVKCISFNRSGLPAPEKFIYAVKKNNYVYFEDGRKKRINGTSVQISEVLPSIHLVPSKYRTAAETTLFCMTHKI